MNQNRSEQLFGVIRNGQWKSLKSQFAWHRRLTSHRCLTGNREWAEQVAREVNAQVAVFDLKLVMIVNPKGGGA